MIPAPASTRRYAGGPTGSGKSVLLLQWAEQYGPRQIEIDTTGECAERRAADDGRPVEWASDKGQLTAILKRLAGVPRWRVAVPSGRIEPDDLVNLLAPEYVPGRRSFPQLLGGICLTIHEGAEVASQAKRYRLAPLWLRGRHNGLTILCASQRSADVGRMVTSQSNIVAVFSTMEPLDLVYWRGFLAPQWYAELEHLRQFEAVEVNRDTRTARIVTSEGVEVRALGGVLREDK